MEVDVSQPNPSSYSHIAQHQLWLQGKDETRTDKNQHYLTEGRRFVTEEKVNCYSTDDHMNSKTATFTKRVKDKKKREKNPFRRKTPQNSRGLRVQI